MLFLSNNAVSSCEKELTYLQKYLKYPQKVNNEGQIYSSSSSLLETVIPFLLNDAQSNSIYDDFSSFNCFIQQTELITSVVCIFLCQWLITTISHVGSFHIFQKSSKSQS